MAVRILEAVAAVTALLCLPAGAQTATDPTPDQAATAMPALDVIAPPGDQAAVAPNANSALDTPIEQIAGTTNGCAVLDKDFPGLRDHPMYGFFKGLSLNQVAALSGGKITADMLAQAQSDLAGPSITSVAAKGP